MHKVNAQTVYDNISKDYKQSESLSLGKAALIEELELFLHEHEPRSVLDLGCGSGVFAIAAKQNGAERVYGVDISNEQILLARERASNQGLNIDYEVCDIAALRLQTKFDAVLSVFGFCYAEIENILLAQLTAAYEHLQSGGTCFFVVCDPDHPVRESGASYRTFLQADELKDGAVLKCEFLKDGEVVATDYKVYWTRDTWNKLLARAGFRNVTWREINNQATNSILYAFRD